MFLLSEAKIDTSFPDSQFFVEGFRMYLKDRTENEGGLHSTETKFYQVGSSILTNSRKILKQFCLNLAYQIKSTYY